MRLQDDYVARKDLFFGENDNPTSEEEILEVLESSDDDTSEDDDVNHVECV